MSKCTIEYYYITNDQKESLNRTLLNLMGNLKDIHSHLYCELFLPKNNMPEHTLKSIESKILEIESYTESLRYNIKKIRG